MSNSNSNKEKFLNIYKTNIKRAGSEQLLEYIVNKTDFFTAPASTKYHGAYEGGLLEHSLNVYELLREEVLNYQIKASGIEALDADTEEKIAIISLLHDLCKVNFYKIDYRNQKNSEGKWEKVPYYTVDNKFNYGHGEKSVFLIERFMRLKIDEAIAIRWHMGGFDEAVKGGSYELGNAWNSTPIGVLLHVADLKATYLYEA